MLSNFTPHIIMGVITCPCWGPWPACIREQVVFLLAKLSDCLKPVQCRQNERDSVSNLRHLDCLFHSLSRHFGWRHHAMPISYQQDFRELVLMYRGPVNSPHKWPVTRKIFPFDDVIMMYTYSRSVMSLLHLAPAICKSHCLVKIVTPHSSLRKYPFWLS